MLRRKQYGPVEYFALARSIAGRALLTTGVYFVDGLLIDTGPPNARDELRKILDRVSVRQVVLTHHHEDHAGNVEVAAEAAGAEALAHPLALPLLQRPPPLPAYRRIYWGTPSPCSAEPLGEELQTEHHRFRVLHIPGHAPDQIALHEPDQGWLFVGDLFLGIRRNLLFEYEDITATIASLRSVLSIRDCMLFCQHLGGYSSHHTNLGKKLDFLLGLQREAVVRHEEGRSIREITRVLGIRDTWLRLISRGELSGRNLIRGLLRDAGKID